MKIGVAIAIVVSLIKGEGGVVPPTPGISGYLFSDDALTINYFADNALTLRYKTGD